MKHLKKFENFDLGHRFSEEENNEMEFNNMDSLDNCEECEDEDDSMDFESEDDYGFEQGFEQGFEDREEDEEDREEKDWNDEEELRLERISSFRSFNEKKMNPGFKAYLDKQKAKKDGKDDDKKDNKKTKPDFLDLDKDGDKKESMKKAAKDAKEDKKEDKGGKGLTAGQKRLPKPLQDAILKKQK
jgi:hypothetical protein